MHARAFWGGATKQLSTGERGEEREKKGGGMKVQAGGKVVSFGEAWPERAVLEDVACTAVTEVVRQAERIRSERLPPLSHVAILVALPDRSGGSSILMFDGPSTRAALGRSGVQWVVATRVLAQQHVVRIEGGASLTDVNRSLRSAHAQTDGAGMSSDYLLSYVSTFAPGKLIDVQQRRLEHTAPVLTLTPDSDLSRSLSGSLGIGLHSSRGIVGDDASSAQSAITLPVVGAPAPRRSEFDAALGKVTEYVAREEVLLRRYHALCLLDGLEAHAKEKPTLATFERAGFIEHILFSGGLGEKSEQFVLPQDVFAAASVVGHWDLRRNIIDVLSARGHTSSVAWFAEREERLCALLHGNLDVMVDATLLAFHGRAIPADRVPAACRRLLGDSRDAVKWYTFPAIDFLTCGAAVYASPAPVPAFPWAGQVYTTHEVVQGFIVQKWLRAEIAAGAAPDRTDSPDLWALANDDDTQDVPDALPSDGAAMKQAGEYAIDDWEKRRAEAAGERYLPRRDPRTGHIEAPCDLPDIESLLDTGVVPPCHFAMGERLMADEHPHHPQRFALSGMLLDSGYSEPIVVQHFKKHMGSRWGRKYECLAKRNERDMWDANTRKSPHGYGSCTKLARGEVIRGQGVPVGCPFQQAYTNDELHALLQRMAPDASSADISDIVRKRAPDHGSACASFLALRLPAQTVPKRIWSPRQFTALALQRK